MSAQSVLQAPQYRSPHILGVLEQQLTFQDYVNTVCMQCYSFYRLYSTSHVRSAFTQDIAKTHGNVVIGAKLDYANAIPHGTSAAIIKLLQLVQNALRESS